jgi:hypothetical protein
MSRTLIKRILYGLITFAFILVYLIYRSLSYEIKEQAKESQAMLVKHQKSLLSAKNDYDAKSKDDSLSYYYGFAKKDHWLQDLELAQKILTGIDVRFNTTIKTILEKNSRDDEGKLSKALQDNSSDFIKAQNAYKRPSERLILLQKLDSEKTLNLKKMQAKIKPAREAIAKFNKQKLTLGQLTDNSKASLRKQLLAMEQNSSKLLQNIMQFQKVLKKEPIDLLALEKEQK